MVLLSYMLSRGKEDWHRAVTPEEVAPYFHAYLTEKEYRKKIDFSDNTTKNLWEYDEEKVSKLIARMPIMKWTGSSKGMLKFEDEVFELGFDVDDRDGDILFYTTKGICEYRLHGYFERRGSR